MPNKNKLSKSLFYLLIFATPVLFFYFFYLMRVMSLRNGLVERQAALPAPLPPSSKSALTAATAATGPKFFQPSIETERETIFSHEKFQKFIFDRSEKLSTAHQEWLRQALMRPAIKDNPTSLILLKDIPLKVFKFLVRFAYPKYIADSMLLSGALNESQVQYVLDRNLTINVNAKLIQNPFDNYWLHNLLANEVNIGALLVQKGKEFNIAIQEVHGYTPLTMAIITLKPQIVKQILALDTESVRRAIHLPDKSGRTPLHWAYFLGDVGSVELLIAAGADTKVRDDQGKFPKDYAFASAADIEKALRAIEIDPRRDENSISNAIRNINEETGRPDAFSVSRQDTGAQKIFALTEPSEVSKKTNINGGDALYFLSSLSNAKKLSGYFCHSPKESDQQVCKVVNPLLVKFTGRSVLEKCLAGQKMLQSRIQPFLSVKPQ
jgi:hypothetical protein